MDRKKITLLSGMITLFVAVLGFNSYMSPTGAAVAGLASGSLAISAVTLIIAFALLSKYFGLVK